MNISPVNCSPVNGSQVNGTCVNGSPVNISLKNCCPVNISHENGSPVNGCHVNGPPVNISPLHGLANEAECILTLQDFYTAGGQLYQQEDGGSIGSDLTGEAARLYMMQGDQ